MVSMVLSLLVAISQPPATYNVYIRPRFEAFGYAGTLTLRFAGNGIINGTYRDANGAIPQSVQGSIKGSTIYLDLPTLGRLHVTGHVEPNGDIDGFGSPLSGSSTTLYIFTASREPAT